MWFSTGLRKTADLRFVKRLSGLGSARLLGIAETASSFLLQTTRVM